nr:TadE/TadG family type IV pilus assembly protein [Roseomonas rubea]
MSKSVSSSRHAVSCRRGVAAVEFAVVAGLFFLTLLAAIDLGRYYMTIQGMRNFIADAERFGIVNLSGNVEVCRTDLVNQMGRGGVVTRYVTATGTQADPLGVCVRRAEAANGNVTVTVTTRIRFAFVVNPFGVGQQSFNDDATVTFRL